MVRVPPAAILAQFIAIQATNAIPTYLRRNEASLLSAPVLPTRADFIAASFMYPTSFANHSTQGLSRVHADGPVQCSESSPCADKSCCNSDGKCGYTDDHCRPAAPKVCHSHCDATAMCGINSLGGSLKCGLNLCCSHYGWCGTEEVHCGNADPIGNTAPCQEGFGGCRQVDAPSCSKDSGTTNGRKIAYYQSWNVRDRLCQKVRPSQINTDGLTHLYFAFASIDPSTYIVAPADPGDVELMKEFTKLKSDKLSTWIAVGGFKFSDDGPTHTTWSDMAANPTYRARFILSLIEYMSTYGFQGVDLDWEYPASDQRGGKLEDTQNFVSLVREMHEAFGGRWGISSVLAPDYWYLRGTDVKALEPYVDFFGFMGYDLHGPWDSDVEALGAMLRPQSDIRDIEKDLKPIWYSGIDPAKVNFGLAYYGRGYTVSDTSCTSIEVCGFVGGSTPAQCTNFAGVMSNAEIRQTIKDRNLQPTFVQEAMVKQITWEDQWIAYDDEDTVRMKIEYANSKCLGGTMIWAIDYDTGDLNNVDDSEGAVKPDHPDHKKESDLDELPIEVHPMPSTCATELPWNCHHCSDKELKDGTKFEYEKWSKVDAEGLWVNATGWYPKYMRDAPDKVKGAVNTFSKAIGEYVGSDGKLDCPLSTDSGTCLWAKCDPKLSPAGTLIRNEFANLKAVSPLYLYPTTKQPNKASFS
jgi:chitinase